MTGSRGYARDMSDRKEASAATQWLLIAVGAVSFLAIAAWSISSGMWWLLAVLVIATVVSARAGSQAGLPLWPGREPRVSDDESQRRGPL